MAKGPEGNREEIAPSHRGVAPRRAESGLPVSKNGRLAAMVASFLAAGPAMADQIVTASSYGSAAISVVDTDTGSEATASLPSANSQIVDIEPDGDGNALLSISYELSGSAGILKATDLDTASPTVSTALSLGGSGGLHVNEGAGVVTTGDWSTGNLVFANVDFSDYATCNDIASRYPISGVYDSTNNLVTTVNWDGTMSVLSVSDTDGDGLPDDCTEEYNEQLDPGDSSNYAINLTVTSSGIAAAPAEGVLGVLTISTTTPSSSSFSSVALVDGSGYEVSDASIVTDDTYFYVNGDAIGAGRILKLDTSGTYFSQIAGSSAAGYDTLSLPSSGTIWASTSTGGEFEVDLGSFATTGTAFTSTTYRGSAMAYITTPTALTDTDLDGYYAEEDDCDDADANTHPGAAASDSATDCMTDADGDGYGSDSPASGVTAGNDCDDTDSAANPGGIETADGTDEDCDGTIDEGTSAYDDDGDGYTEADGDCDDADSDVNPGETEVWYNGVDENCDDNDDDKDGDGYAADPEMVGSYATGDDCDDENAAVHPNAAEQCNGEDDDCDGDEDEDLSDEVLYADRDGDGYGDPDDYIEGECDPDSEYTASNGNDPDDGNANTYPGAPEVMDGEDNNDNGHTDECLFGEEGTWPDDLCTGIPIGEGDTVTGEGEGFDLTTEEETRVLTYLGDGYLEVDKSSSWEGSGIVIDMYGTSTGIGGTIVESSLEGVLGWVSVVDEQDEEEHCVTVTTTAGLEADVCEGEEVRFKDVTTGEVDVQNTTAKDVLAALEERGDTGTDTGQKLDDTGHPGNNDTGVDDGPGGCPGGCGVIGENGEFNGTGGLAISMILLAAALRRRQTSVELDGYRR